MMGQGVKARGGRAAKNKGMPTTAAEVRHAARRRQATPAFLHRLAGNPDPELRAEAWVSGHLRDTDALAVGQDPSVLVRRRCAQALTHPLSTLYPALRTTLLSAFAADSDPAVRRVIAACPASRLPEPFSAFDALLEDPNMETRRTAWLGRTIPLRRIHRAAASLDWSMRSMAALALSLDDATHARLLVDTDPRVVAAALRRSPSGPLSALALARSESTIGKTQALICTQGGRGTPPIATFEVMVAVALILVTDPSQAVRDRARLILGQVSAHDKLEATHLLTEPEIRRWSTAGVEEGRP